MRDAPPEKLGFGVSGPLGQFWFSAAKTRSLIEQALAGGITHFDTAPFYFDAEARLGAALSGAQAPLFISTKTGTRRHGTKLVKDFSAASIRRDVDDSRRRLRRESLDLLYLHGPTTDEMRASLPTLSALKREGKVKAIGVCGAGEPLALAAEMGFDAIMGVFNVMDRRNADIFASAKARGLMTVAVAPLAQGLFDPRFSRPESLADLWRLARAKARNSYDRALVERALNALGEEDRAGRALGFVLSDPAIDIVMTTTTKPRHLAASLAAKPLATRDYDSLKGLTLDHGAGRS